MNAKEKAMDYLKDKTIKSSQSFWIQHAIDIAIQEAKKEVFDDIDNHFKEWEDLMLDNYEEIKKRHLSKDDQYFDKLKGCIDFDGNGVELKKRVRKNKGLSL